MKCRLQVALWALTVAALSTSDSTAYCAGEIYTSTSFTQKTIEEILKDFKFVGDSTSSSSTFERGITDPDDPRNKIARALLFLKNGEFIPAAKSRDESFFNNFNDTEPYDFFYRQVKTIVFSSSPSMCLDANPSAAFVVPYTSGTLYVCLAALNNKVFNISFWAAALVHEAAHLYSSSRHVTCSQGLYKGRTGSCDRSRRDGGAYSFDTDYRILIAKFGRNFHPAIKEASRNYALFNLLNRFNEVPKINIEKVSILHDRNNVVWTLDGSGKLHMFGKVSQVMIDRPGETISLYDSQTHKFKSWSPYDGVGEAAGEYAKWANTAETEIKDVLYYSDVAEREINRSSSGMLLKDNILKFNMDLDLKSNAFRGAGEVKLNFSAKRFASPWQCDGSKSSLFIEAESGQFYEVSLDTNNQVETKANAKCSTEFLKNISLAGRDFAVSRSGVLMERINNVWTPINVPNGNRFKFMSQPKDLYEFFENREI